MRADDLIRTERRRAGMSQRELAERTGVAQSTIANIERGRTDPRASTLNALLIGCGTALGGGERQAESIHGLSERAARYLPEMTRRIARRFQPTRIILFGSQARGRAGRLSDVDLLVVFPTDGDRRARRVAIRSELADMIVDKDILVTTEREAAAPRPGSILATALSEGVPLHVG